FLNMKTGKKRSGDGPQGKDAPAKKEKAPEFNGTVFKALLKEPTTAMKGLETFISTAKNLPCPGLYDVVEGYIKISMECTEIFKLLEVERHVETEMMLIFESLEMILLRTASDLTHFNMVGNTIVKKVVSSYMKLLQGSFHSGNHRFVRQCLSLLSALVSQGPEAAREVLGHIHINKALSGLAKRKDKKGKPDVRMAFIQFALSFLVSGDNATVGQILEIKELLPEILSTGLKEDRLSLVSLILSTLKTRVILNKAISKTQKVRFFTPSVLANIASLYKWNGIVDMEENSEHAGLSVIRELVQNFLLELCCSRKHGINFYDASFGTLARAGNIVLLQFLVGLKQATEDELVAELVANILTASPDVLARYFKETQHLYTPRLKSAWQDNIRLLKKIYQSQPELSTIFHTSESIPLPRLLSMIMVISLPPVCNKAFFTQGLGLSNTAGQVTTLSMMNFILKKANKNIEYLLDESEWHSSDVYTADMMGDLVQQYRETLSKVLPDMTSIVAKWQSLSKKEKTVEEKKSKTIGDTEQMDTEVIMLKALILQVICLYQKVVPHLVSQCKFDFSKLLKGIVSEKGMREEVPPVLQHQILQLALELPASKFSWFRIQDVSDTEASSGEKSVLYLLLKMFVSSCSSSSHLKISTRMLVLKVLKDSGVFEYTSNELELWLDQLAKVEPNEQETVIQFLEKVLVKLVCNSYSYTDKVASLVQEAAYLHVSLSSQEADAASIPVSHIDDVLDMLDVIMEGNDGEMEEFGPSISEDLIIQTFPFSVVVPAALEARNKLVSLLPSGVVYEYLSAVLCDVLHCQREPLPLCLALLQYDKELVSSELSPSPHPAVIRLHQYYSRWLPQQCQEELVSATHRSSECLPNGLLPPFSYTALMKAAYIQGPGAFLEDTFKKNVGETLAVMLMAEFPVAVKQLLLYIKSTVEDFGKLSKDTGASLLKALLGQLCDLVTKLQGFQETESPETAAESSQEGAELFLELDQLSTIKILVSTLGSIFKHPCLEQWFLALELSALPPHTLNPVRLKHMCAQLTDNILALLKISAPILQDLNHLNLLSNYMGALERAVLKELIEKGSLAPKKQSRPFQALLFLHSYMDPFNLREVVSKLLLLPQESLISPSSDGTRAKLSVYGLAALQILTESISSPSQEINTFLTWAHFHGLGTLLLSCSSPALEAFLLQVLSSEPGTAKLIHTDVLLHCIQKPLSDSLALSSLLLQNSPTHRLCFETWCLEPANMKKFSDQRESFLPLIHSYLQVASREDPAKPKDEVVTEKLADFPEEQETWRKSVTSAALKCLITSFSHSKDQTSLLLKQEHSILERLERLLVGLLTSNIHRFLALFLAFHTLSSSHRHQNHHFLNTLTVLLNLMYGSGEVQKDLIPLSTLHMMTSSHSLFLPTILEEEPGRYQSKEALVSLLLCLVKKCPSVCNTSHFVVLLGAYGATLSTLDQKLLLLLQEYERNHVSLLKFQAFLWGPAALEHHKTRKSLGASLWKQTSSDELLALLKTNRMLQTIAHFPQRRKIILEEGKELLYSNDTAKDNEDLYDPCFLMPLFSAILRPECVIDCLKFVSSHALSLTIMALSSYDSKMRAAAYHVLSCFYQHLEGARFREKRQLLYLMDTVKNGVRQQNQRLPFVLTTYITKAAQQMLKPEDHMYKVLNRFLLSHQSLDFRRVPEFFKLFYGFDLEHKIEREWILSVLEEGISDGHCYELCDQQGIFQSLLGFSSSPLCDEHSQAQIMRLLCQAARVTKASLIIIHNVFNLLHLLWFTNLGQKEKRVDGAEMASTTEEKPQSSVKCLPLPLISEFMCVASTMSKNLRLGLKAAQLSLFLQTFCSILKHRGTALNVNKQAEWLTLLPQPLSCTEVLALLLCWASLSCNKALCTQIQVLSEKCKIKELLGKDKMRSKSSFSKACIQKENLADDTESEKQGESPLEACKYYLGSIFVHWEPVFPFSQPQQVQPKDNPAPSRLASDTAHLLIKWSLRCMVEDSYDENRTKEFLHWVEKAVIKHREIVDVVLTDPGLKADLLRLYHQAFESKCQPNVSGRAETLQRFTNIMIHLLETQGPPPEGHQAVISACRPETASGHLVCGKSLPSSSDLLTHPWQLEGLYLLSLYIHELWSGATSTELFMSHVNLVTRTKCKRQKTSKSPPTPIGVICNDIITLRS
uniref:URB1 ribosome biogenesis homolog n=1 Tax=Echeneis naucrates TaxID=173247 RepID=A0A665V070_ECHNA